ncbi:MAG: DUF664 domain-containing protein [Bryobacteraceae bacterium]|nr:DUF664 domain-containing protein [Bryobacteraceae bacterium]
MSLPEPWLRGSLEGVDAMIAPALFSFQQAREDLAQWTEGLSAEQIWARPHGLAPLGFQLKHIAGSVERLTTYLEGRQLDAAQIAALKEEMTDGAGRDELLAGIERAFARSERVFRALRGEDLKQPRAIGRKQLPTTVIGLLVHIAEHTQRHVGQAIVTAKVARDLGS